MLPFVSFPFSNVRDKPTEIRFIESCIYAHDSFDDVHEFIKPSMFGNVPWVEGFYLCE